MFWFTADNHFNHENIIEFCDRPFRNADHMNEVMVDRWNQRVGKLDTVIVVGDFKLGAAYPYHVIRQHLNGNIVHVRGNHDPHNGVPATITQLTIETFGMKILVVHDPVDAYLQIENFDLALVGHVHKIWKFQKYLVNVGVDVWDYYPVHMKQILKAHKYWRLR